MLCLVYEVIRVGEFYNPIETERTSGDVLRQSLQADFVFSFYQHVLVDAESRVLPAVHIGDCLGGARWLVYNEVPERFLVFRKLCSNVVNEEFGSDIEDFYHYDTRDMEELRKLINFFADWMRISDAD